MLRPFPLTIGRFTGNYVVDCFFWSEYRIKDYTRRTLIANLSLIVNTLTPLQGSLISVN